MRNRLAVFGLIWVTALSAVAEKQVSVEQLQQMLASAQQTHRTDDVVVRQLADTELSERLSDAQLKQLLAASPGSLTTTALRAMADASVFLNPPAGEIPSTPAPDVATQRKILGQAIHYAARTLPGLPNFLATRATTHYDDSPQALTQGAWPVRAGLHPAGNTTASISFRDGRETDDPTVAAPETVSGKKGDKERPAATGVQTTWAPALGTGLGTGTVPLQRVASLGMNSWGEFGPILGIVLVDVAKGKLGWGRWEVMDGKPVAVFQFSVDRSVSHYTVQYCCSRTAEVIDSHYGSRGGDGRRGGGEGASKGMDNSTQSGVIHQLTGYHGSLAVDPDTGTILRITLSLDLKPEDPIQRGAMMVQYGPVKIGETTYICPTRSVTLSTSSLAYDSGQASPIREVPVLQLNDVSFVGYRRFGSEATLVADNGPDAGGAPTGADPVGAPAGDAAAVAPASPEAAVANVAAVAPAVAAPAAVAEEDQEMLVRAVDGMPFAAKAAGDSGGSGDFTLKVTTRLVDVSLVAFDKHGKPVADLKPGDIEIYDNGRKQTVHAFHHAGGDLPATAPAPEAPAAPVAEDTFTNTTPVTISVGAVPDMLILLMDESHLAFQDLNRARDEVLRFIKATRPTSRIALYSIGEHGFHVIQDVTQDHALVTAKLAAWVPSASSVAQAQALDRRNRQQIDTVHSASDLNSVNGNFADTPDTMQTTDPELRQMGDNPLRQVLEGMTALARHFSAVPGHKSLAWISGDSALADWEDKAVGMEKGSKQLENAIAHTREALNEAHMALYAVDASNLEGGQIDSSLENANVTLNQAAMDNASLYGGTPGRNSATGRITGAMQQDLHGIQGPIQELANATGGRAVRKGSNLAQTLGSIEQDGLALYEVGFEPDTAADGKFHTLELKIPSRKDLKLRYRTGYVYSEQAVSNGQRFQQTVWSPQDASGVGLTAEAVPASEQTGPAKVRLRIAFKDVGLQQQTDPKAGREVGHWTDKLYIFVAQRNDATQQAEVSGDTLRLSLKQATYESGMPAGIPYQREVEIKSKLGSVRVIVVDANSGRIGSVTLPASALHP